MKSDKIDGRKGSGGARIARQNLSNCCEFFVDILGPDVAYAGVSSHLKMRWQEEGLVRDIFCFVLGGEMGRKAAVDVGFFSLRL